MTVEHPAHRVDDVQYNLPSTYTVLGSTVKL